MAFRLKAALGNAVLLVASLAVTYVAASFVIFRVVYPELSLNLRPHFPDIAEIFAQNSKAGTVPRDTLALLGDSYAEGQGDGLFNAKGDRAKAFHSAHALQRLAKRDVISLGMGGAGSAQAMVRMPTRILRSGCFLYPALEAPRQMLVYFYEGNDLDENGYVANVSAAGGAVTRQKIERYHRAAVRDAQSLAVLHRPCRDDVQDGALPRDQRRELGDVAQTLRAQQGDDGRK